ncbi:MAG: EcsC family protein [Gammaproteobacteria bacterium]|jgi:hypothetical protein
MKKHATAALPDEAMSELRWAYEHLEHPSLAARLSNLLAYPIEEGLSLLHKPWRKRMERVAQEAICKSMKVALASLDTSSVTPAHIWMHRFVAVGAGGVAGFFGPLTLLAELPFTTTLILRSIADIANSQGEDLSQAEACMACVQVFALGGRTRDDEAADLGYYGMRITLGLYFERDILEYAAGTRGPHIPAAIEYVRAIAARFGVVVSDKTAAQMVPIAGALSGSLLNLIFIRHYQDVAKGHFIVRRLERDYGSDLVRKQYQRLVDEEIEAEQEFSPVEGW